jgi:hypothetical protein
MWQLLLSDSDTNASSAGDHAVYRLLYNDVKNNEVQLEML